MTQKALEVCGVSHSFGARKALNNVALDVPEGSFTALLGINGAGKSTLFNLITRLYDNVSGTIRVCGHDVRREPRAALRNLGVVFQSRALDTNLTIAQNIVYHGALHGFSRRESLRRGEELLDRVNLTSRMDDKVRALSGGQVRRAEIARALLHGPRLLLCDEATVGLDVKSRRDIVAEVHAMAADEGVGVLWASHLIDEVRAEDSVVIIHLGQVLAAGSVAEVTGGRDLSEVFLDLTGASA
ncbi:ATP-binding cassette domain-containing protein [Rhodobacteraceae bacterium NNCM2]|nr:ATP-binding cassette domain-containing protein [Coraliihabitans acroporae]